MRRNLVSRIDAERRIGRVANPSAEEKDLVIIGGGVAGYVAAIKAGQAGLKVSHPGPGKHKVQRLTSMNRSRVSRSVAPSEEPA